MHSMASVFRETRNSPEYMPPDTFLPSNFTKNVCGRGSAPNRAGEQIGHYSQASYRTPQLHNTGAKTAYNLLVVILMGRNNTTDMRVSKMGAPLGEAKRTLHLEN